MEQESSASGLNIASPAFSSPVWETVLGMLAAETRGSHTTLQRTGLYRSYTASPKAKHEDCGDGPVGKVLAVWA